LQAFKDKSNICEYGQNLPKTVATERYFARIGFSFTRKSWPSLERPAKVKQSSLCCPKKKVFITLTPDEWRSKGDFFALNTWGKKSKASAFNLTFWQVLSLS
jgi:hypothetical protein